VSKLFEKYGLDYQNHIIEEDLARDPPAQYQVDIANLRKFTQAPKIDVFKIVHDMVAG
jgi:hypothetical protein